MDLVLGLPVANRTIRTYPDPFLRKKCKPIGEIDGWVRELADEMVETMYAAPGVGLAAPQLGEPVRLITVDLSIGREKGHLYVLVNPEILESAGEQFEEEGCLSLPDVTERVRRFGRVCVRALNRGGKEVVLDAQKMLSRVLQHEIDHLDGKLLLDRLSRVKRDLIKRRLKKQAKAAPAR